MINTQDNSATYDTGRLTKAENGAERFVDAPLLLRRDLPDEITKSAGTDCSQLFDKYPCRLAEHVDLGAERGSSCA